LQEADIRAMASKKSKVVWSPFSNLLLYGKTLELKPLIDSGILFSLGCDWSPSGGKNLLVELKVARFVADKQNAGIDSRKLVEMITANPAEILGWDKHLGKLAKGMIADIVAIAGQDGDPYDHLVNATDEQVALVVIDGVPRYGDQALMEDVFGNNSDNVEKFKLKQKKKAFYLFAEDSALNDLPLSKAVDRLEKSLADLPALKEEIATPRASLLAAEEEFTLVLDMEDYEDDEPLEPELFAAAQMADSIPLDSLFMVENDLGLIDQQMNIPEGLAKFIRDAY
jgi:5-methylthioadenosine/S-adenosylhomocysteine deaminase